jgi:ATPase subunit of ABC transporter with duplicated ATPase domains
VLQGLGEWSAARARYRATSEALERAAGDVATLLDEQAAAAAAVERLGGWDLENRATAMLTELGVREPDRAVGTMSGGERRRVALAALLVARPTLAILDEPTNHLDAETIEWLERYLREEHEGALLLITHDRWVLDRVVDRTLELEAGAVHSYDGAGRSTCWPGPSAPSSPRARRPTAGTCSATSSSGSPGSPRRAPASRRRGSSAPRRRSRRPPPDPSGASRCAW